MLLAEKIALSPEELESQATLELPDREMLGLITIVIKNVLNGNKVRVTVKNNHVAVQVCAIVDLISTKLVGDRLTCRIVN